MAMNKVPYVGFNTILKAPMALSEQYHKCATIISIQIPCLLITYNHHLLLLLLILSEAMIVFIVAVTGYNRD